MSPEQDAAVELTLVPGASPGEAAQAFFSQQQGIARIGGGTLDLDGNDAVLSEFQAQTQGGGIRGYVAHIAHGNTIYQLVGYGPAGAFDRRAAQLREIVTSFEPVRDRDILDIEPRRVEIVELPEPMSLREFADRYPSGVPIEELALLNHVDDAAARIDAGTRLKRVVGESPG